MRWMPSWVMREQIENNQCDVNSKAKGICFNRVIRSCVRRSGSSDVAATGLETGSTAIRQFLSLGSKIERRQSRMIVRTTAERPMELAVGFGYGQIIDAGKTPLHKARCIVFPIFVAVGTEPVAAIVMPFIGIADGNPVLIECPQFLDQPVVEFLCPFAGQERDDFAPAGGEFCAVSPSAVFRVGKGHALRVA